nr:hypothetical protein [Tanacetum cinerariifolium]
MTYEMLEELMGLFERDVVFETAKLLEFLYTFNMYKGQSMGLYVLKIMSYVKQRMRLRITMLDSIVISKWCHMLMVAEKNHQAKDGGKRKRKRSKNGCKQTEVGSSDQSEFYCAMVCISQREEESTDKHQDQNNHRDYFSHSSSDQCSSNLTDGVCDFSDLVIAFLDIFAISLVSVPSLVSASIVLVPSVIVGVEWTPAKKNTWKERIASTLRAYEVGIRLSTYLSTSEHSVQKLIELRLISQKWKLNQLQAIM